MTKNKLIELYNFFIKSNLNVKNIYKLCELDNDLIDLILNSYHPEVMIYIVINCDKEFINNKDKIILIMNHLNTYDEIDINDYNILVEIINLVDIDILENLIDVVLTSSASEYVSPLIKKDYLLKREDFIEMISIISKIDSKKKIKEIVNLLLNLPLNEININLVNFIKLLKNSKNSNMESNINKLFNHRLINDNNLVESILEILLNTSYDCQRENLFLVINNDYLINNSKCLEIISLLTKSIPSYVENKDNKILGLSQSKTRRYVKLIQNATNEKEINELYFKLKKDYLESLDKDGFYFWDLFKEDPSNAIILLSESSLSSEEKMTEFTRIRKR